MEIVEKIRAEVERLRDTTGITFNELVCFANVLRIIDREYKIETDINKVRDFTNMLGYYTNALEYNSTALKGDTNER